MANAPRPSKPSVRATMTWMVKLASACVPCEPMAPRAALFGLTLDRLLRGACDEVVVADCYGGVRRRTRDVAFESDGARRLQGRCSVRRAQLPGCRFCRACPPQLRLDRGRA